MCTDGRVSPGIVMLQTVVVAVLRLCGGAAAHNVMNFFLACLRVPYVPS